MREARAAVTCYPNGDSDTRHIPFRSVEMQATFWKEPFIVAGAEYLEVLAGRFRRDSQA
jgi:hypothetical protein